VVVARKQDEDVSWLLNSSLNITHAIYTVDNTTISSATPYKIPLNKGHEAMIYLSYIIDNYDALSDITIFIHAHQITWHNNDLLDSDSLKHLEHLLPDHVTRVGYFNLRCHHEPGCPDWLHLDRPDDELDTHRKMEERAFSLNVWKELHPNVKPPKAISQPCCAQFAVSRDRIRALPREEYIRYRKWVTHTKLDDIYSGRVMEYSYQFIFAGVPELCPEMHVCYCNGYGVCFGGKEELQEWFDQREKMRALDKDAVEMSAQPEKAEEMSFEARRIDTWLRERKEEAFLRGKDPSLRALEVGRP
jgi:hypothetical protein